MVGKDKSELFKEPKIHSYLTEKLPEDHKWAYEALNCPKCNGYVHISYNDCVMSWVEIGDRWICLRCFFEHLEKNDFILDNAVVATLFDI